MSTRREVMKVGGPYGDEGRRSPWIVSQLLYAYAVQQCFSNIVWDAAGITLFVATLATVLRYFLHNQTAGSRNFLDPPRGIVDFALGVAMAGDAILLAQSQNNGRMAYLLATMAAIDGAWAYRSFRLRGRRLREEAAYCRTRVALDVVLTGFLITLCVLAPVPPAPSEALPNDVKFLISVALFVVSVVDYLLNQHVYTFRM